MTPATQAADIAAIRAALPPALAETLTHYALVPVEHHERHERPTRCNPYPNEAVRLAVRQYDKAEYLGSDFAGAKAVARRLGRDLAPAMLRKVAAILWREKSELEYAKLTLADRAADLNMTLDEYRPALKLIYEAGVLVDDERDTNNRVMHRLDTDALITTKIEHVLALGHAQMPANIGLGEFPITETELSTGNNYNDIVSASGYRNFPQPTLEIPLTHKEVNKDVNLNPLSTAEAAGTREPEQSEERIDKKGQSEHVNTGPTSPAEVVRSVLNLAQATPAERTFVLDKLAHAEHVAKPAQWAKVVLAKYRANPPHETDRKATPPPPRAIGPDGLTLLHNDFLASNPRGAPRPSEAPPDLGAMVAGLRRQFGRQSLEPSADKIDREAPNPAVVPLVKNKRG